MKLVGVQFDIAWEDRAANFARVRAMLAKSPPQAGDLVVLPEMFGSGFSMNLSRTAEDERRETEIFLAELAREHDVYVIAGQATLGPNRRGRNEAVVVDPVGDLVARYRKIHPFSLGKEADYFSGGDAVVNFEWALREPSPRPSPGVPGEGEKAAAGEVQSSGGRSAIVAPFVCYDLRFPEIFRIAVLRGAQVIVVIANWPAARIEHWVTLLKARAIENQAYVIGVNRCGKDPYLSYPGRSMIVDFRGQVLAEAGEGEEVIAADVDTEALCAYRRELPFLGDMRRDFLTADERG